VKVDEDFLEYCEWGALSVEVYGHKEQGTLSLREIHDQVKACSIRGYFFPSKTFNKGIFLFISAYFIQHCPICRPSDFTVPGGCWDHIQD
jgi:hypothetical protein